MNTLRFVFSVSVSVELFDGVSSANALRSIYTVTVLNWQKQFDSLFCPFTG